MEKKEDKPEWTSTPHPNEEFWIKMTGQAPGPVGWSRVSKQVDEEGNLTTVIEFSFTDPNESKQC